ncbi:hypothetical protein HQ36_03320 [Porphyromonas gingivicanis]|uniref:Uncharacterized protein n=1 Tax=Porphyromonas gingivicanis TaxID=266762 RepID=A0A0A2G421_9PORP|nr:hypothetical protein [Porphyromonas gingivicanis]KGN97971.1 hypothetical protein HQ36_03320 [Porphyromonas gingivicanis]
MKKTLLFLCAFLFPTLLLAQSRETKSRWGIELGMQNNVYYEHSLSDAFAIKTGISEVNVQTIEMNTLLLTQ